MSNYSLSVLSGCPYKERGFTVCRSLLLNILNIVPEYRGVAGDCRVLLLVSMRSLSTAFALD